MRHRQPVDLRVVLIVYNFAMVGLSTYMFHEVRVEQGSGGDVPVSVCLPVCLAVPGHVLALQLQLPLSACGLQHQPSGDKGKQALWYLLMQACVLQPLTSAVSLRWPESAGGSSSARSSR